MVTVDQCTAFAADVAHRSYLIGLAVGISLGVLNTVVFGLPAYRLLRAKLTGRIRPVRGCARCGHDHRWLAFLPLERPIVDETFRYRVPMTFCDTGPTLVGAEPMTVEWKWWARCPITGDPVLLADRPEA